MDNRTQLPIEEDFQILREEGDKIIRLKLLVKSLRINIKEAKDSKRRRIEDEKRRLKSLEAKHAAEIRKLKHQLNTYAKKYGVVNETLVNDTEIHTNKILEIISTVSGEDVDNIRLGGKKYAWLKRIFAKIIYDYVAENATVAAEIVGYANHCGISEAIEDINYWSKGFSKLNKRKYEVYKKCDAAYTGITID